MRMIYVLALPMLPVTLLPHLLEAKPFPDHAKAVFPADTQRSPRTQPRRRALVYGLPPGWTAVFQTVATIQPPLIRPVFVQFFSTAAQLAIADPTPGRHVQRIPFGSLILEFVAGNNQIVTKEFVVAASLWLLNAAQNGWTGFFEAWVVDKTDGEIIFVRLTTMWDELVPLSF